MYLLCISLHPTRITAFKGKNQEIDNEIDIVKFNIIAEIKHE
jgi:hypothetical protein